MKSAQDLFGNYIIPTKGKKTRRGELLKYFSEKTGRKIGYIAFRLTGLKLKDLYYIKSISDTYEREGKGPWSKCFFGSIKSDDKVYPQLPYRVRL